MNFAKCFYLPHYPPKSICEKQKMLNFDPEMQPLMQKNNFGNFVRKLGPSPPKNVNFAKSFYVTHYSPNSKSKAENYEI